MTLNVALIATEGYNDEGSAAFLRCRDRGRHLIGIKRLVAG
jgi:hypothetical protein